MVQTRSQPNSNTGSFPFAMLKASTDIAQDIADDHVWELITDIYFFVQLSPTGKISYNVDLAFSVQETVCSKNSGLEFDDSSCIFRPVRIAVSTEVVHSQLNAWL